MRLDSGWSFAVCAPGAATTPQEAASLDFSPAQVPGTAAGSLAALGRWFWDEPVPLDERDVWYATNVEGHGSHRLAFDGLATYAEIFLDDTRIATSDAMFTPVATSVELEGRHRLAIRFKALASNTVTRKGRARWRPRMIQPSEMRFARTSALGHMPGFAPPAPPVGPWRPVWLIPLEQPTLLDVRAHASLDGDDGVIDVTLTFHRPPPRLPQVECEGARAETMPLGGGDFFARLHVPSVEKWLPHTHGEPRLYSLRARIGPHAGEIARVGFRTVEVDRGDDGEGFGLRVNGLEMFCRGAVWTQLDPVALQNDPDALAHAIDLAKTAGVNMFRVGATGVYESDAFYRACDEAGILVWQDFMFANFDYPAGDPDFAAMVEREARAFLARTSASPSLVVLCGGNEVYQQAAMMGVAESFWRSPLFEDMLPGLCAKMRPDAIWVANSPSGGALPFHSDSGVAHYYGVGAYRRPLEDARRANVRFATECLGFANVPETRTLEEDFGPAPLSSPLWGPRIPRDQGADQDFEQVRDHYVALLYGVDPVALKQDAPQLYLDLSRAAVAEAVEATIGEWRRPQSSCRGAILWFWKDLWASSGWGVLDWKGRPKSPWWAMRRAFRPVQVMLSDEGVNGLHVHCLNERATAFEGTLTLRCFKDGATIVMNAQRAVRIEPRGALLIKDCDLWGAFFDTGYAYRFGPPSHEATVATLTNASGAAVAEAWHFPLGRQAVQFKPALAVEVVRDTQGYGLRLTTDRIAQSVKIEDNSLVPLDNWLHLAPGEPRIVRFIGDAKPQGIVAALGGEALSYPAE